MFKFFKKFSKKQTKVLEPTIAVLATNNQLANVVFASCHCSN